MKNDLYTVVRDEKEYQKGKGETRHALSQRKDQF